MDTGPVASRFRQAFRQVLAGFTQRDKHLDATEAKALLDLAEKGIQASESQRDASYYVEELRGVWNRGLDADVGGTRDIERFLNTFDRGTGPTERDEEAQTRFRDALSHAVEGDRGLLTGAAAEKLLRQAHGAIATADDRGAARDYYFEEFRGLRDRGIIAEEQALRRIEDFLSEEPGRSGFRQAATAFNRGRFGRGLDAAEARTLTIRAHDSIAHHPADTSWYVDEVRGLEAWGIRPVDAAAKRELDVFLDGYRAAPKTSAKDGSERNRFRRALVEAANAGAGLLTSRRVAELITQAEKAIARAHDKPAAKRFFQEELEGIWDRGITADESALVLIRAFRNAPL